MTWEVGDVVELDIVIFVIGAVTPVGFVTVEETVAPTILEICAGFEPMPELTLTLLADACVGCPSRFEGLLF
jgi:hypothetical protein